MTKVAALVVAIIALTVIVGGCGSDPERATQDDFDDKIAEVVDALNTMNDARTVAAAKGIESERGFFSDPASIKAFTASYDRFSAAVDWILDVPPERIDPDDRDYAEIVNARLRAVWYAAAEYLAAGRNGQWSEAEQKASELSTAINTLAETVDSAP